MSTYEIVKTPFQKKTFTGSRNGKEMVVWELELKDAEGMFQPVELVQLATTPAPQEGQTLEGTVDTSGPYAAKFTKAPTGGSKSTGGYGGKSPEERAEIRRSVAQKAAVALLAVEVQAGLRFESVKASELLTPRIQFFFDDLSEAAKPS